MLPRAKKALSVNSESRVPKEPKECLKGKKILSSLFWNWKEEEELVHWEQ